MAISSWSNKMRTSSHGNNNTVLFQPMYTPFYKVKYIGFPPTFIKPNLWNAFEDIESLWKENDQNLVDAMEMIELDKYSCPTKQQIIPFFYSLDILH